ncbi:MAG: 3',5'-cyclic AMP phosphodiesterase CpdA [Gammaproteobacteria bacterium]|jgi:3',5'-cyclic AMP phosphodiesterase CpdA
MRANPIVALIDQIPVAPNAPPDWLILFVQSFQQGATMDSFTVLQISDAHLSRSHAYFQDNFDACVEYIAQIQPDLVVVSGDLTFNGPDVADDIAFGREQLGRIECPWVAIPGNHDVGEPGANPRLGQSIDPTRLGRWQEHFGDDRFCIDLGGWRLLGINSELLGSGLDAESEQWDFFDTALAGAAGRDIGFFLHKPMFIDDADSLQQSPKCVYPESRQRLLQALSTAPVRFVASGHVHCYHHSTYQGLDIVWSPPTAFVDPQRDMSVPIVNRAGLIKWQFDGKRFSHAMVEPARFVNIDVTNWSRESGTSITLPPLAHRADP